MVANSGVLADSKGPQLLPCISPKYTGLHVEDMPSLSVVSSENSWATHGRASLAWAVMLAMYLSRLGKSLTLFARASGDDFQGKKIILQVGAAVE